MKVGLAEGFLDCSRVGVSLLNCVGRSLSLRVGYCVGVSERVTVGKMDGLGVVLFDGELLAAFEGVKVRIRLVDEFCVGDEFRGSEGFGDRSTVGTSISMREGLFDCVGYGCADGRRIGNSDGMSLFPCVTDSIFVGDTLGVLDSIDATCA